MRDFLYLKVFFNANTVVVFVSAAAPAAVVVVNFPAGVVVIVNVLTFISGNVMSSIISMLQLQTSFKGLLSKHTCCVDAHRFMVWKCKIQMVTRFFFVTRDIL